jgi:hypothetical protein
MSNCFELRSGFEIAPCDFEASPRFNAERLVSLVRRCRSYFRASGGNCPLPVGQRRSQQKAALEVYLRHSAGSAHRLMKQADCSHSETCIANHHVGAAVINHVVAGGAATKVSVQLMRP